MFPSIFFHYVYGIRRRDQVPSFIVLAEVTILLTQELVVFIEVREGVETTIVYVIPVDFPTFFFFNFYYGK